MSVTRSAGLAVGNGAYVMESVRPSRSHSSSARCGHKGESICTSGSATLRGVEECSFTCAVRALFNSINLEIAVLKRRLAMSALTPAIALCSSRCSGNGASPSVTLSEPESSSTRLRQMRWRNRCMPMTSRVFHGREASSGPVDISYRRNVSAPYSSYISSGVTMFFRLLPILPYSRVTCSPFQE